MVERDEQRRDRALQKLCAQADKQVSVSQTSPASSVVPSGPQPIVGPSGDQLALDNLGLAVINTDIWESAGFVNPTPSAPCSVPLRSEAFTSGHESGVSMGAIQGPFDPAILQLMIMAVQQGLAGLQREAKQH